MSHLITILHLSDLHISTSESTSQSIVLEALWNDIRASRDRGHVFDFAFFTGDLIAKGDYSPIHMQLARRIFIDPLLEVSGLPNTRLFIVPGNHDVQLSKRSLYVPPVFDSLDNQESVRAFFVESERAPLAIGLESFSDFVA
jgi:3',5'-cyclic AMP phosphodiesterase CpdA